MEWRLFEGIPAEDVRAVLALARRSTYRRGEVVFHHRDPADAVQAAVDEANELVSRAESIRAFRIVPGDFTIANGMLTSSLKLRRAAIAEAYADDIRQLYVARE